MQTSTEIGRVGLWFGGWDTFSASRVRELAAEIEAMGWPIVWIPEAVGRDAMVLSSIILSATTRLKVATGIAQIHARHPMAMKAAQNALNEGYDNRFLLGLGVSHAPMIESMRKVKWEKPYALMKQYLADMQDAMYMGPQPSQQPPTVLAALGPKMLELAATAADGAHPYLQTPEHTAECRRIMGDKPLLAPEQMVILTTDADEARTIARKNLATYMALPNYTNNLARLGYDETETKSAGGPSDRVVDAVVAWGNEDAVVARVKAQHDAGADHVCVQHLGANRGDDPLPALRRLAAALL
ncbi:MAG: TIGR03620 family F420-dependent LLM class oxidoreductase [Acidimicrobiia bacterium]